MKRMALFIVLLLSPVAAGAGEFYDGLVAYNASEYAKAVRHWRPLAERHDAKAQSGLGFLYYKGLGVPRDTALAVKWFRRAADQGGEQAQLFLGMMYFDGEGVARDYPLAHMWADLAVGGGLEEAIAIREHMSHSMTQTEIEKAWRLTADWYAAHKDQ